jgi:hypothetical protein
MATSRVAPSHSAAEIPVGQYRDNNKPIAACSRCRFVEIAGEKFVTDAVAGTAKDEETAMHAIAAAMRDAATTASEHAAAVRQSASEAGPKALDTISRMAYTGSYVFAYGIVYAAVFVAQSLPHENAVMRGLRDGGRAAADELGEG